MSARLVPRVNHMEGSDGDDGECVIAILDTGIGLLDTECRRSEMSRGGPERTGPSSHISEPS